MVTALSHFRILLISFLMVCLGFSQISYSNPPGKGKKRRGRPTPQQPGPAQTDKDSEVENAWAQYDRDNLPEGSLRGSSQLNISEGETHVQTNDGLQNEGPSKPQNSQASQTQRPRKKLTRKQQAALNRRQAKQNNAVSTSSTENKSTPEITKPQKPAIRARAALRAFVPRKKLKPTDMPSGRWQGFSLPSAHWESLRAIVTSFVFKANRDQNSNHEDRVNVGDKIRHQLIENFYRIIQIYEDRATLLPEGIEKIQSVEQYADLTVPTSPQDSRIFTVTEQFFQTVDENGKSPIALSERLTGPEHADLFVNEDVRRACADYQRKRDEIRETTIDKLTMIDINSSANMSGVLLKNMMDGFIRALRPTKISGVPGVMRAFADVLDFFGAFKDGSLSDYMGLDADESELSVTERLRKNAKKIDGKYDLFRKETHVIEFLKKMKDFLESPETFGKESMTISQVNEWLEVINEELQSSIEDTMTAALNKYFPKRDRKDGENSDHVLRILLKEALEDFSSEEFSDILFDVMTAPSTYSDADLMALVIRRMPAYKINFVQRFSEMSDDKNIQKIGQILKSNGLKEYPRQIWETLLQYSAQYGDDAKVRFDFTSDDRTSEDVLAESVYSGKIHVIDLELVDDPDAGKSFQVYRANYALNGELFDSAVVVRKKSLGLLEDMELTSEQLDKLAAALAPLLRNPYNHQLPASEDSVRSIIENNYLVSLRELDIKKRILDSEAARFALTNVTETAGTSRSEASKVSTLVPLMPIVEDDAPFLLMGYAPQNTKLDEMAKADGELGYRSGEHLAAGFNQSTFMSGSPVRWQDTRFNDVAHLGFNPLVNRLLDWASKQTPKITIDPHTLEIQGGSVEIVEDLERMPIDTSDVFGIEYRSHAIKDLGYLLRVFRHAGFSDGSGIAHADMHNENFRIMLQKLMSESGARLNDVVIYLIDISLIELPSAVIAPLFRLAAAEGWKRESLFKSSILELVEYELKERLETKSDFDYDVEYGLAKAAIDKYLSEVRRKRSGVLPELGVAIFEMFMYFEVPIPVQIVNLQSSHTFSTKVLKDIAFDGELAAHQRFQAMFEGLFEVHDSYLTSKALSGSWRNKLRVSWNYVRGNNVVDTAKFVGSAAGKVVGKAYNRCMGLFSR